MRPSKPNFSIGYIKNHPIGTAAILLFIGFGIGWTVCMYIYFYSPAKSKQNSKLNNQSPPAMHSDNTKSNDSLAHLPEITLQIIHGLTKESAEKRLESIRVDKKLRPLSVMEATKNLGELGEGIYGYLSAYIFESRSLSE